MQSEPTTEGRTAKTAGCGMLVLPPLIWLRTTSLILGPGCAALLAFTAAMVQPPPVAGAAADGQRSLSGVVRSREVQLLHASWMLATMRFCAAGVPAGLRRRPGRRRGSKGRRFCRCWAG